MLFKNLNTNTIGVLTKQCGYAMIRITPEQVEKYRVLYQNKFGESIDIDTARIEVTALVSFIGATNRHMKQFDWPDLVKDSSAPKHEHAG